MDTSDIHRLLALGKPLGIGLLAAIALVVGLHHGIEAIKRRNDRRRTDGQMSKAVDGERFFTTTVEDEGHLAAVLTEATGTLVAIDPHARDARPPAKLQLPATVASTKVTYLNGGSRLAREARPDPAALLSGLDTPEEVLV